jgi:hypothetical protein
MGHPAKFAPIAPVNIWAGQTHQLLPTLQDLTGSTQQPTERITYRSNNPRIHVSDTGLVTTNIPPSLVSRRGASEHANIQINHGGVYSIVDVTVSTYFDDVVSD